MRVLLILAAVFLSACAQRREVKLRPEAAMNPARMEITRERISEADMISGSRITCIEVQVAGTGTTQTFSSSKEAGRVLRKLSRIWGSDNIRCYAAPQGDGVKVTVVVNASTRSAKGRCGCGRKT